MTKNEAYVIWDGPNKGIYLTWEECQQYTDKQKVRFKGFKEYSAARRAYELGYDEYMRLKNKKTVFPDLF